MFFNKLIITFAFLLSTFSGAVQANSSAIRTTIDSCSVRNPTDFSLIAKCISREFTSNRSSAEADFFIFMDEIEEEYRGGKQSLAKSKGSLIRAWQDLDNKEKAGSAANDQRLNQEEQNRIAEDQKRQFEVMRQQNYKACVRKNCVSFVDSCIQSRMHCVP